MLKAWVLSKLVNQTFISWKHLIHISTAAVTRFSPGTGVWKDKYVLQGEEEVNGIDAYHEQPV